MVFHLAGTQTKLSGSRRRCAQDVVGAGSITSVGRLLTNTTRIYLDDNLIVLLDCFHLLPGRIHGVER